MVTKVYVIRGENGYIVMCPVGTGEITNTEFLANATFFETESLAYRFIEDHSEKLAGFCTHYFHIEGVVVLSPQGASR